MHSAVVAISFLVVVTGASAGGALAVAGESLPNERARPGKSRREALRFARVGAGGGGKVQRAVGPDSVSPAASDARSGSGGGSSSDRTDSELMLEALKASGVESPNAHRIDRVVDEIRAETKRKMSASPAVWKDPFAEDPERAIPVRSAGRYPRIRPPIAAAL